jgi:predicted anti-sigma-YlaC factor YlaD
LRLDDELSEFELFLLDSHLERCAECCEFVRGTAAFTAALRAAPLEERERPMVSELSPPRRRHPRLVVLRVASAVVLVVATGGAIDLAQERHRVGDAPQIDTSVLSAGAAQEEVAGSVAARRAHLLATTSRWWIPRRGFKLS